TAIGVAGVPGGSIPLLVMVLEMVGVPGEGIALVLGVDRILDMARTVPNVTGDLLTSILVTRSEGLPLVPATAPDFSDEAAIEDTRLVVVDSPARPGVQAGLSRTFRRRGPGCAGRGRHSTHKRDASTEASRSVSIPRSTVWNLQCLSVGSTGGDETRRI